MCVTVCVGIPEDKFADLFLFFHLYVGSRYQISVAELARPSVFNKSSVSISTLFETGSLREPGVR